MTHLSDEQIDQYLISTTSLAANAALHLTACLTCQQTVAELRALMSELTVAGQSQPTPAAMMRYQQLFASAAAPSALSALVARVVATLAWDSRQQPALQGVRGSATAAYRLLFSSTQADLEVAVSGSASIFTVEGEFIQRADHHAAGPVLVSLLPATEATAPYETETDPDGRFKFAEVQAGSYTLAVMPASGALIEIEDFTLV